MPVRFTKYQLATAIAILFHIIGLTGLLFFDKTFFLQSTAVNLLLMFALLVWTQASKNSYFFFFFAICFLVGMIVEIIGVHTGALFGHYHYGVAMGYKILDVPLILGVNWFIVLYCSGVTLYRLTGKAIVGTQSTPSKRAPLPIVAGGALLAVFYDWLMEPVAVKLNYWSWDDGLSLPIYNYVCWFAVSALLLAFFQLGKFDKRNKFAVNLLLIQLAFFLLLRLFLH